MSSKVEPQHLKRKAYVYVRQSTMAQVERNVESGERQYEFVERAVSLGWSRPEVVVLDGDTARSAKSTDRRDEFQQLVAEVGLGPGRDRARDRGLAAVATQRRLVRAA